VLGKAEPGDSQKEGNTEMQVNGEVKYLVQRISGGTHCEITGKDRRIEVQVGLLVFVLLPYIISHIEYRHGPCLLTMIFTKINYSFIATLNLLAIESRLLRKSRLAPISW